MTNQATAQLPLRRVRVKYKPAAMGDQAGWAFTVLAAETDDGRLVYLGEGWSTGRKANAVADFEEQAKRKGWTL